MSTEVSEAKTLGLVETRALCTDYMRLLLHGLLLWEGPTKQKIMTVIFSKLATEMFNGNVNLTMTQEDLVRLLSEHCPEITTCDENMTIRPPIPFDHLFLKQE